MMITVSSYNYNQVLKKSIIMAKLCDMLKFTSVRVYSVMVNLKNYTFLKS